MKEVFTLILICCSSMIISQELNHQSETNKHKLLSDQGIEYEIIVTCPPNYDDSKSYKTLYYLDAWWLEDIIKGCYTLLNRTKLVQELVLVGISIDGTSDQFTKQRTRDYTPSPFDMQFPFILPLESGSLIVDSTNSGQSDLFKIFLKDIVFPFVSKAYSIDKADRGFLGHSFGGLFGVYDAFDNKALFENHIIIAPALWWNKSIILYDKLENDFKEGGTNANLFICYGKSESISIIKSTNNLIEYFKNNSLNNLNYNFQKYENEDHVSLLPESIYEGIEHFYKK